MWIQAESPGKAGGPMDVVFWSVVTKEVGGSQEQVEIQQTESRAKLSPAIPDQKVNSN